MDKKHIKAGLMNLIANLPDDAVDVVEGNTTIEIFIDWAKVPDE